MQRRINRMALPATQKLIKDYIDDLNNQFNQESTIQVSVDPSNSSSSSSNNSLSPSQMNSNEESPSSSIGVSPSKAARRIMSPSQGMKKRSFQLAGLPSSPPQHQSTINEAVEPSKAGRISPSEQLGSPLLNGLQLPNNPILPAFLQPQPSSSSESNDSISTFATGVGSGGGLVNDMLGSPSRLTPPTTGQYFGPRRNSTISVSSTTSTSQQQQQQPIQQGKRPEDLDSIPPFYLPGEGGRGRGKRNPKDSLKEKAQAIEKAFSEFEEGVSINDFPLICKDLCGYPMFFSSLLFRRIKLLTAFWNGETPAIANITAQASRPIRGSSLSSTYSTASEGRASDAARNNPYKDLEEGTINISDFVQWWEKEVEPYDEPERIFRLLKKPDAEGIYPEDLIPMMQELLDYHPGLEFLENTPEFQEKYARTVIARIIYKVNTSMSGMISLRELRASDLVQLLHIVDEEEEINAVNEYFSYEHFYCLYCRFWELDTDHDLKLSKEDLLRYGNHSLTLAIVNRIFDQVGRKFICETKDKMGYEDFIFFCISEEDKTSEISLRYWFKCIDLDGDGVIRDWEIRHFYDEQFHRMQSLGQEEVLYKDVISQMTDCLNPKTPGAMTIDDFLQPNIKKIAGVFFNLLFNLNKVCFCSYIRLYVCYLHFVFLLPTNSIQC